jgi:phage/plasmid-associated DNA primase
VKVYRNESNPAAEFVRDHYQLDEGKGTSVEDVYFNYREWVRDNGHTLLTNAQFGKEILREYPSIQKSRPRRPDGSRASMYSGLISRIAATTAIN